MNDLTSQKDRGLYRAIQQNRFCYMLDPNPTNRASLQARTRQRLERMGYRCVTVQVHLSFCPPQKLQEYPWDKSLISSIWNSLYPAQPLAISQWLRATARFSSQRRLEHFVRDLLFLELREKPLVIFIDEIDSLFAIPFAIRELLIWIEKCYKLQGDDDEYQTLSFVMLGSSRVTDIVTRAHVRLADANNNQDWIANSVAVRRLLSAATKITCEIMSLGFSLHKNMGKFLREVGFTYFGTRHYETTGETTGGTAGKFRENIFIW